MKTNKKGFTIVELTIVIAVIAILAAVLIPTFVSLVNKANNSADVQMVTNINKYLASIEAIDGKNETMAEAMADAAEVGYTKGAFQNLSSGNTILWDEVNDRFLAINEKGKVVAGESKSMENEEGKYWIVSQSVNDKYATYLVGNAAISGEIKLGLDLTEYTGKTPTITVGAENVKINGVVKALNANGKNPTVYGYVAELTGNVVSKNATFDKCDKVDTQLISGDFKLEHYPDSTGAKCLFCEAELVEVSVDHVHNYELKNDKCEEANCTSIGLKWYECSCGSAKVETIDALGHEKVQREAQSATCTAAGWDAYVTCSRSGCDYTTYKVIPAGHEKVQHDGKKATCTENGWDAYETCSRCDYTTYKESLATGKHEWETIDAGEKATCTVAGREATKQCTMCKQVLVGKVISAQHSWKTTIDSKEPTCTEPGYTMGKTCTKCGKETGYTYLPSLGHQAGENGLCLRCGEKVFKGISADDIKNALVAGESLVNKYGAGYFKLESDITMTMEEFQKLFTADESALIFPTGVDEDGDPTYDAETYINAIYHQEWDLNGNVLYINNIDADGNVLNVENPTMVKEEFVFKNGVIAVKGCDFIGTLGDVNVIFDNVTAHTTASNAFLTNWDGDLTVTVKNSTLTKYMQGSHWIKGMSDEAKKTYVEEYNKGWCIWSNVTEGCTIDETSPFPTLESLNN